MGWSGLFVTDPNAIQRAGTGPTQFGPTHRRPQPSPNASSRPRHLFTAGRQTESKGQGLQGQRVASLCTLQDIMRGLQSQDKTRGTRTRLRQRWTRTRINERDTRREPQESRGTSRDRTEGQLASRIYTIKRTGLDFTPSTGLDKAVPSCGRQH